MAIDYLALSQAYRPAMIRTLLVGESPPPSGTSYFYLPCSARPQVFEITAACRPPSSTTTFNSCPTAKTSTPRSSCG